jgi:hypothetical protein
VVEHLSSKCEALSSKSSTRKKKIATRYWWLTKIAFESQSRQIVGETLSQKKIPSQKGLVELFKVQYHKTK